MVNLRKVWLALCFFPIENHQELTRLQTLLSPFMRNIQKCFVTKSPNIWQRRTICENIVNSASSVVDPNLRNELNRLINQPQNELSLGHKQQLQLDHRLAESLFIRLC